MNKIWHISLLATLAIINCGCSEPKPVTFHFNEVELVRQERLNLDDDERFKAEYRQEVGAILTALFGTPSQPDFPFLYEDDDPAAEVLSLDNLKMSAGPVKSGRHGEPSGLYREHCVQCHGISGDGRGPTAAFLNPYPRDFRAGKFKFKATRLGQPPTDGDLVHVIRNGIPGTAMPAFKTLSVEEVESLVDYVKYLSVRGQLERKLISELDSLDGDPLLDLELAKADDEDSAEEFEDQLRTVVEEFLVEEIVERWAGAEDAVTDVPVPPDAYGFAHEGYASFVESGRQLFRGKANCVQCHGPTGLGDGQNDNYDYWTNELKTAGVDLDVPDSYQLYTDAGAFRPRRISPRNLQLAVFRGGDRPEDIYRRIANGIEGTPMPSAPTLSSDEIWALVAYVKNMKFEASESVSTPSNSVNPTNPSP